MQATLTLNDQFGECPIYIGNNLISEGDLLRQHIVGSQIMLVSNTTVAPIYLDSVRKAFSNFQCEKIILPDGEAHKNISEFNLIIDALADNKFHRDATIVALGGGVITDIAGFAAACYHRGINVIQIPTTLLAQVDASVGGKTAVNHSRGKNLIGAFHQPGAVIIDTSTLTTLPEREFNAGMAELIKTALIKDANLFEWCEQHLDDLQQQNPKTLTQAITDTVSIKASVVAKDYKERGERALLNLGHTFGHAIENNLGYGTWLHGEAVAMGIILASKLSQRIGWLSQSDCTRIEALLKRLNLPSELPSELNCDKLLTAMRGDKKVQANKLRFVLLRGIGDAVLTAEVEEDDVLSVLEEAF